VRPLNIFVFFAYWLASTTYHHIILHLFYCLDIKRLKFRIQAASNLRYSGTQKSSKKNIKRSINKPKNLKKVDNFCITKFSESDCRILVELVRRCDDREIRDFLIHLREMSPVVSQHVVVRDIVQLKFDLSLIISCDKVYAKSVNYQPDRNIKIS
jgi:hypothetical protein